MFTEHCSGCIISRAIRFIVLQLCLFMSFRFIIGISLLSFQAREHHDQMPTKMCSPFESHARVTHMRSHISRNTWRSNMLVEKGCWKYNLEIME